MTGLLQVFWLLPGLLLGSFLPWYFFQEPKRIAKSYVSYAGAFLEILSIKYLLLTLLSHGRAFRIRMSVRDSV